MACTCCVCFYEYNHKEQNFLKSTNFAKRKTQKTIHFTPITFDVQIEGTKFNSIQQPKPVKQCILFVWAKGVQFQLNEICSLLMLEFSVLKNIQSKLDIYAAEKTNGISMKHPAITSQHNIYLFQLPSTLFTTNPQVVTNKSQLFYGSKAITVVF